MLFEWESCIMCAVFWQVQGGMRPSEFAWVYSLIFNMFVPLSLLN